MLMVPLTSADFTYSQERLCGSNCQDLAQVKFNKVSDPLDDINFIVETMDGLSGNQWCSF